MANAPKEALALHKAGQLDEARAAYIEWLKDHTNDADTHYHLGILYAQCNNNELSINHFQQAIKLKSDDAKLYNALGNIYLRIKNLPDAKKAFDTALLLDPTLSSAGVNLGNYFSKLKEFNLAVNAYQKVLSNKPHHVAAYFNLGLAYIGLKQNDDAKEAFSQCLNREGSHPSAHGQIAAIYLEENNLALAIHHFQKRLEQQPLHPDTHHDIALAYIQKNNLDAAKKHLQTALQINPNQCDAHYHLASIYLRQQQFDLALKESLQQLNIEPHLECYYNAGVILTYKERLKDAIDYFQSALAIDETHLPSLINLASLYLKSRQMDAAILYYEKALSIEPNNPEIRHILSAIKPGDDSPLRAPNEYVSHLFNQYAPHYDEHLIKLLNYSAPQLIIDALERHLAESLESLSVIDLGCGTGLMGECLKPISSKLIGIDISESMIEEAKNKHCYDTLIVGDIETGIIDLGPADLITAADVLPYIGDLNPLFNAISLTLNAGGYFAATIEKGIDKPYQLQATVRYSHQIEYIKSRCKEYNLHIIAMDNVVIREQNKENIEGILMILKR